ncbi:isocitrate lyase/PEP mutase family protein [Pararhodobacter oceanensis]|uniref:isocitrate lyase/PEP mutase family protein n=1 Tax=Pararhodobacter oceanensis TaxID=2172121 RepID=UPI003A9318E0
MKPTHRLRELLAGDDLLVSPGVYDVYSLRAVEQAGFKTACTTGAGIANSRYGFPDLGIMSLSENLEVCRTLARSVSIPVMADADTGYGNPSTVFEVTRLFEETGVAGINIEDQLSPKRCGHMDGKEVISQAEMVKKIEAACDARRDDDFVILARTDAIAIEGIDAAIERAQAYARAGADLIFADAVHSEEQIQKIVDAVEIPISVNMGFGIRQRPTTPLIPLSRLHEIGVRRVTLPRMLPAAALNSMTLALAELKSAMESGEIQHRPDLLCSIDDIWNLMGYPESLQRQEKYDRLDG